MVVSDIEDVFVPLVDGFLVSPQEARSVVDRYVCTGLMMFIAAKIFLVMLIQIIFIFSVRKVQYLSRYCFSYLHLNTFFFVKCTLVKL